MKIFLDFDRTLYDLDAFHETARGLFESRGISRERYNESKSFFSHGSGKVGKLYTPEEHESAMKELFVLPERSVADDIREVARNGEKFVFGDVTDFLKEAGTHDRIILTFGDAEYQQYKIAGAGLESLVDEIIVTSGSKVGTYERAPRAR